MRIQLITILFGLLIALGVINFLLLKILYTYFGPKYSFFVDQGINLLYIIFGGSILYPRMLFTNKITPAMRAFPQWKFMALASLDGIGTFLTALGAPKTPGQLQPLLNQSLIPCTMFCSWLLLRRTYDKKAQSGAFLIVAGGVLSVLPQVIFGSGSSILWYAVVFYVSSNVPMALSAVYKQIGLKHVNLDIWYLVQWISIYQFLLSFLLVPLLAIPGFGTENGIALSQVPRQLYAGFMCSIGYSVDVPNTDECKCESTEGLWLLIGYCAVNFAYNGCGLAVTKHGSAVLRSMSFSILLPLSAIAFSFPFLGEFQESISVWTLVGLVFALFGFWLYRRYAIDKDRKSTRLDQDVDEGENEGESEGESEEYDFDIDDKMKDRDEAASVPFLSVNDEGHDRSSYRSFETTVPIIDVPDTFQERVVGMGLAFPEIEIKIDVATGSSSSSENHES